MLKVCLKEKSENTYNNTYLLEQFIAYHGAEFIYCIYIGRNEFKI